MQTCNRKKNIFRNLRDGLKAIFFLHGGGYLKKSELILRAIGSAGGIPPRPPFRPPRQKAEAERTISSFSNPALRDCEAVPRLAANSF